MTRQSKQGMAGALALAAVMGLQGTAVAQSMSGPPPSQATATTAAEPPPPAGTPAVCRECGVVQSIRTIAQKGEASGVGAVAGGVLGGVLGHQIGNGRGNTVATIAGAGAGAYAGHQIEKNRNTKTTWEVAVRMDDGRTRTMSYGSQPGVREGDRVKLANGRITRIR